MNNRIKKIMLIVIFLIGVIIFIYPIVSEMIKSYLMQHTIVEYKKEILNNNVYIRLWNCIISYYK